MSCRGRRTRELVPLPARRTCRVQRAFVNTCEARPDFTSVGSELVATRIGRDKGRDPMLRRLQASFVLLVSLVCFSAAAQEPTNEGTPAEPPPAAAPAAPAAPPLTPAPAPAEAKPPTEWGGWHTEVSGYFRAPLALGLSSRPGP